MRSNLSVEVSGPAAWKLRRATWTSAIGSKPVVFNQVTVTLDQSLAALCAAGIFPLADFTGEISGVDVAQSRLLADFDGAQQIFGTGVAWAGHLVVAVERGDVPGNIGRDASQEFGKAAQFVGRVVEI